MPTLRFSRDKRGYETTSLVHAFRHRGRAKQRILYWFRTPPNVKVGRAALDEDAIRWIEEHHPDIEFNWRKILEAQPPPPAPADDGKIRRGRREKSDRRRQPRSAAPRRQTAQVPTPEPQPVEAVEEMPDFDVEPETEEALEQLARPDAEELPAPTLTPVESVVGREQLTHLRARYAELQARFTERGGTAERVEAFRAQAESLNPDTWVTEDEARKGVAEFEPRIRELRAALGLRRRRRSHRGGRRRRPEHSDQTAQPAPAPRAPNPNDEPPDPNNED